VWVLLTVLSCSFLPSVSLAQQPTATISALSGTVLINGQEQGTGTVLSEGDVIETQSGATVVLELSDGSLLELGENTKVNIAELSQAATGARVSRMKLLWGRIRAALSPGHQQTGSSFDISTPNALVGVKFSQPDVEVSYDPAKQETVVLALTVALAVKNLITDEEKMIPIGSFAIITALGIKVMAGAVATGTIAAGSTSAGTVGAGAGGIGKGTMIALGAGAVAAAGGVAAVAASSGDEDKGDSGDGIDWDNPFTGTFKFEGRITLDDPDNTPADAIDIYYLTQQGNSVTGTGDATITTCCTFTDTTTATGTVDGNTMILTATVISSTVCTCPDGTQWRTPIGMNWTHTCTLAEDGSSFQFENGMVYIHQ